MHSALPTPATAHGHDAANKRPLFLICVLAITTTSMSFVLRSSIAQDIQTTLFDPIDPLHSAALIGSALGVAFLSFAVTVALGSPLIDAVGMRTVLLLCGVTFVAGTGLTILADRISSGAGVYNIIWLGMLLSGMGWGCSEAVINPLTTTLYPEDKTHKLNVLHAWWPGGIIIGGLAGLAIGALNLDWRFKFAVVLLPATVLIVLLLTSGRFPKTERAAAGIPASEMFRACLTPAFLLWFLAMFLTSAAELAPGQWVDMALTRTVGMSGIWLLVYVSGLMFVMRHFAGTMVHKLSSVGLLWVSCLLAAIGLVALSVANSPLMGFLAATIWGTGVCYMWPTMLAVASERFPRSGALGMGLIGTAGSLSIYFLLPQMGKIFDAAKIEAAGGEAAFTALSGDALNAVLAQASTASFRIVAFMPAVLLIVFGLVWLNDRRRGGFKPEKLFIIVFSAAALAVSVPLFAQTQGPGQGRAEARPDPHKLDMFMCDWRESMPRHTHGGLIERDILTHGDPQTSTTRCAVLAHTNYVSYATLAARGGIAPMKLQGQQEIFYVVSGKGTVTSAGETSELYDGVGILVPPGVEFSMKNTGDDDLNMYIINELVPADFKPGSKVLVRDENLQPVRGTTGHWVHIVKNIFTPADGLATLRQTITVALDPMTIGEPHAHTAGSEEVWIQIKGKSLAFIGTQLRWQTPGMGYLAPPFAEMTQENVRNGLSFPHSNINPGPGQVKFLYFQTARRPAPPATAAQPTPR